MKQTVELESGRKATVNIPMDKLNYNASRYQRNTQKDQGQCDCEARIVMRSGQGCSCSKKSDNSELKAIVAELQASYDSDVQKLNDRIKVVERQNTDLKAAHALELQSQKHGYEMQLEKGISAVELLKAECMRKDKEIMGLIHEKDVLMRNKITQFRHCEDVARRRQFQDIIRLKDLENSDLKARIREFQDVIILKDADIKDLNNRIDLVSIDKTTVESNLTASQLKWEAQIKRIQLQFVDIESRFVQERSQINLKAKNTQDGLEKQIKAAQIELALEKERSQKNSIEFQSKLKVDEEDIKNYKTELESKNKDIDYIKLTILESQEKISMLEAQISETYYQMAQLKDESIILIDKLKSSEEAVMIIDKSKSSLLLEISARMEEVDKLKKELLNVEKVVEVKIERVVEGKPEIQRLKCVISELDMQLKQFNDEKRMFSEEARKSQKTIDELRATILQLRGQISELKIYIEKREGSFKWAVERQIQRDIAVTDTSSQIYKVSQIREYTREASPGRNVNVMQEVSGGIQAHILGNVSEQLFLNSQRVPPQ